jgi:Na+/H+ antiporter NhaD/arsenite permease-like protein
MNPAAVLSLASLLIVIAVSMTARINVGVLAITLAAGVAILAAGWTAAEFAASFPAPLFLILVGVTLLFGIAVRNGTLAAITARMVKLCGHRTAILPVAFFLLTFVLAAIGPGAIASVAIMAPLAMSAGVSAGVPAFLLALMVGVGANAGTLSPVSLTGIISLNLLEQGGLGGHEAAVFISNFVAHMVTAVAAYLLFGGLTLLRENRDAPRIQSETALPPLTPTHWLTISVLTVWLSIVIAFEANPGLVAFPAAAILILARAADDNTALSSIPWSVIIMVSGVSLLISVLDKTGGMDLFTQLLANIARPSTVNGIMAFVAGVISSYSSTSGVVLPAFLPTVSGLVERLGGGDPLEVALSINIGAALVDVSPLSTIGALCIAAVPPGAADTKDLFRKMLLWGFSMALYGAVFCQLFVSFFAW